MSKRLKIKTYSPRKANIFNRRNPDVSSMEEAHRIFQSLPQEVQNEIHEKRRKLFHGRKND